ncbi:WW domain binding protein 4 [Cichlidogyrus casuarinus]|uniref:WW domain binding protein 4 n=1 Tax=Cichlidogyrus casuarinus TaxID=1844966 RepID=A0ABD2Q1B8_9PLAT
MFCIQNHETGDRHKAAVQKKINAMQKNNVDIEKEKVAIEKSLGKMNDVSAAMSSMMKDIARDPSLAKRYGVNLSEEELAKLQHNQSTANVHISLEAESAARLAALATSGAKKELKASLSALNAHQIKWREVKHLDGRIYYWNKLTNETSWERPNETVESLSDVPVDVQAEKDRVNQFLFNRLIQLSESGVSGASEAVCQAFDASPSTAQTTQNTQAFQESSPRPHPKTDSDDSSDSDSETRPEIASPSFSEVKRGSHLLGEWQTVEEE